MRIDEKTNVNGLLENNAVGFFYISHFFKSTIYSPYVIQKE